MKTHELTELLTFYGHRLADVAAPRVPTVTAVHQEAIKTVRDEISRGIAEDAEGWERRIETTAAYFWSGHPFDFRDIPVQDIFLSLVQARRQHADERHRYKGVVWTEAAIYDGSRIQEFFRSEIAFMVGQPQEDAVRTIRFSEGRFDVSPAEVDRIVSDQTCEWIWMVWDSLESITDEVREALWRSSFARLIRDYHCTVRQRTLEEALLQTIRLKFRKWTDLPMSLFKDNEAPTSR